MVSLLNQIAAAKAEVAQWEPGRREAVVLQGPRGTLVDEQDELLARANEHRFNFAVMEVQDAVNYFGCRRFARDLVRLDPRLGRMIADSLTEELTTPQPVGVLLKKE